MTELTTISVVFGIVVALLSVITFFSTRSKSAKDEGAKSGELQADIKYIKNRQDEVYITQKEMDKKLDGVNDRLVRVEAKVEEHDKQISNLEKK